MKKITLLLLLISSFTTDLFCMKRRLDTNSKLTIKKTKREEAVELQPFPFELQTKICIGHLPGVIPTTNFEKTCSDINALTLVNKQWKAYINNPTVIRTIINHINNQLHPSGILNQHITAKTISTRGARNYIQQTNSLFHKILNKNPRLPLSIQELVTAGADVNFVHPKGHFLYLASTRDYEYTKALLNLNADLNATTNNETALSLALKNNRFDMVKLLLRYKPKDKCPKIVIEHGTPEMIEFFLRNGHLTADELSELSNWAVSIDPDSLTVTLNITLKTKTQKHND